MPVAAATVARVLIDRSPDKEFDYSVPGELAAKIAPGCRVRVPLGGRRATGTVTGLPESAPVGDDGQPIALRPLAGVLGDRPLLSGPLIALGRWLARYYSASFEATLRSMIPEAVRNSDRAEAFKTRKVVELAGPGPGEEVLAELVRRAPKQAEVLNRVREAGEGGLKLSDLPATAVKALEGKGLVRVRDGVVDRDPFDDVEFLGTDNLTLNPAQAEALENVLAAADDPGGSKPMLLHGVTGSGKTEVYLQAVQHVLDRGKSALVLVPEISLTPQTVDRFKSRFADRAAEVAVLHSHLSAGERHDEWHKVHRRQARIVVGARSAVFAPLDGLGLIIVDEEHEPSYKQDSPPRYHARDIAVVRASIEGSAVLLGSATPSLESFQNARSGKYQLLSLPERADDRTLPLVRVVDLRTESRKSRGKSTAPSALSEPLRVAIDQRLDRGEQVILFLNRRGYSTSLVCQVCGHVCGCRHCSVPLTFHKRDGRLVCHVCGFRQVAPERCPAPGCGDPGIRFSGFGTQRVEEQLRLALPRARVVRVDADAMGRKHQLRDTLNDFRARKSDILVGTQMIAKGLDFPNVTLVGVLNADLGLHLPDFRAGERTFQLLTQVAGRAGRGELKGEVVIQTFTPHAPAVQFARHHDYLGYAEQELPFRQALSYPPFAHVVTVTSRAEHERRAEFTLQTLERRIGKTLPPDVLMGETAPAPLAKSHDQFRFQLMLRGKRTSTLTRLVDQAVDGLQVPPDVTVVTDVDPVSLL